MGSYKPIESIFGGLFRELVRLSSGKASVSARIRRVLLAPSGPNINESITEFIDGSDQAMN